MGYRCTRFSYRVNVELVRHDGTLFPVTLPVLVNSRTMQGWYFKPDWLVWQNGIERFPDKIVFSYYFVDHTVPILPYARRFFDIVFYRESGLLNAVSAVDCETGQPSIGSFSSTGHVVSKIVSAVRYKRYA